MGQRKGTYSAQVCRSFTKHKRPISSEAFEVLHTANQLGLNTPESLVNSAWFLQLRKERP